MQVKYPLRTMIQQKYLIRTIYWRTVMNRISTTTMRRKSNTRGVCDIRFHKSLWKEFYRAFHGFWQTKFPDGGLVLGSSQFFILLQLPPKILLDSKVVKIDPKKSSRFVNLNPWHTLSVSSAQTIVKIVFEVFSLYIFRHFFTID